MRLRLNAPDTLINSLKLLGWHIRGDVREYDHVLRNLDRLSFAMLQIFTFAGDAQIFQECLLWNDKAFGIQV
jgi:hypothetical protein